MPKRRTSRSGKTSANSTSATPLLSSRSRRLRGIRGTVLERIPDGGRNLVQERDHAEPKALQARERKQGDDAENQGVLDERLAPFRERRRDLLLFLKDHVRFHLAVPGAASGRAHHPTGGGAAGFLMKRSLVTERLRCRRRSSAAHRSRSCRGPGALRSQRQR